MPVITLPVSVPVIEAFVVPKLTIKPVPLAKMLPTTDSFSVGLVVPIPMLVPLSYIVLMVKVLLSTHLDK